METNLNKIEAREIMPGCHGKSYSWRKNDMGILGY